MCASSILAGGTIYPDFSGHTMIKKPELLAPAGNLEKLEIAVHYGADAVYLAGKDFSLRNFSGNFSAEELAEGISYAHARNVAVYIACNIYSRNHETKALANYLETIGDLSADAVIVSDPGILYLCKTIIPHIDIHLSTQANTTNYNALEFWKNQGVRRVNLARELSLEEIQDIAGRDIIETEAFVHGAMCISYSGRCLLSSFLSLRDSNRGLCSHPCRWRYSVVEEKRPGEYYPVMEDKRGTYIFNSRDLCMIEHIPELIRTRVTALKIEGRMKGIHYLAATVNTYRQAIDAYCRNPETYSPDPDWYESLRKVFNRTLTTGFYFSNPDDIACNFQDVRNGEIHGFAGKIVSSSSDNTHRVAIRNKLSVTDPIEIISPGKPPFKCRILGIKDKTGNDINHGQPNTIVTLFLNSRFQPNDIIRKTMDPV